MEATEETPAKKKKVAREIMEKSVNRAVFDEFESSDSEVFLRTIVDFEFFEKETRRPVPLDQLSHTSGVVSMRGTLVEPLPQQWRECLTSLLSTTPAETRLSVTEYATLMKTCNVRTLDWDSIKEGDTVDGYCPQTFHWYEAKIVQCDPDLQRFKIHFRGWNSKYDEWVERGSARLVPRGVAKLLVEAVDQQASRTMPWFLATSTLLDQVSQVLGTAIPERCTQKVVVEGIEDWCMDYTYPNPTLWVVARSGVWYRLAGPLCPDGCLGTPSKSYAPFFAPALELYICAAHVAMTLIDMLVAQTPITFQSVVDEVTTRSGRTVNELTLLHFYVFLLEQLVDVVPPESSPEGTQIKDTPFYTQLKKEGKAFAAAGGVQALRVGEYKGPAAKRRLTVFEAGYLPTAPAPLPSPTVAESKQGEDAAPAPPSVEDIAAAVQAAKARKSAEQDFPLEDEKVEREEEMPLPSPSPSQQLLSSLPASARGPAQERLLFVHAVLRTFPVHDSTLLVPASVEDRIPDLQTLADAMERPLERHAFLRNLFLPLLAHVLEDTLTVAPPSPAEGHSTLSFLQSAGRTSAASIAHWLGGMGDAWLEVLRELYGSDSAVDVLRDCSEGLALQHCRYALERCTEAVDCSMFLSPVNPDLQGVEDYLDVVRTPMDISTLLHRLETGWYNSQDDVQTTTWLADTWLAEPEVAVDGDTSATSPPWEEVVVCAGEDQRGRLYGSQHLPGEVVDVFNGHLGKWVEAVVLDASPSPEAADSFTVRYLGWGAFGEEVISAHENRILTHRSASLDKTKRLSPSELMDKYPQLFPLDADMLDCDEPPPRTGQTNGDSPDTTPPETTRGRGVSGLLQDVQLLWQNVYAYFGRFEGFASYPVVIAAEALRRWMEQDEVVQALLRFHTDHGESDRDRAGEWDERELDDCTDPGPGRDFHPHTLPAAAADSIEQARWQHVCWLWSTTRSFHALPLGWRVFVLCYLTGQFLDTQHARDVSESLATVLPRKSLGGKGLAEADTAGDAASTSEPTPKKRKLGSEAVVEEDDRAASLSHPAWEELTPSLRRAFLRPEPFGSDRFGHRYYLWTSTGPGSASLVLCECCSGEVYEWRVFATAEDVHRLMDWLDERGVRECQLLHALLEHFQCFAPDAEDGEGSGGGGGGGGGSAPKRKRLSRREVYKKLRRLRASGPLPLPTMQASPLPTKEAEDGCGAAPVDKGVRCSLPARSVRPAVRYRRLDVELARDQTLGLGVKAGGLGNAQVFVTSFKSPDCVAARSGFRIGDRLLLADRVLVTTVTDLKAGLQCAQRRAGEVVDRVVFRVVVCRRASPAEEPAFADLLRRHEDVQQAYLSHPLTGPEEGEGEGEDILSELLEKSLALLDQTAHPSCTVPAWRLRRLARYVHLLASRAPASSSAADVHREEGRRQGQDLVQYTACALLDLEHSLHTQATSVRPFWASHRLAWRSEARHLLAHACPTTAPLGLLLAQLDDSLDREALLRHATCLPVYLDDRLTSPPASAHGTRGGGAGPTRSLPRRRTAAAGTAAGTAAAVTAAVATPSPSRPTTGTEPPSVECALAHMETHLGHTLVPGRKVLYFGDGHAYAVRHAHRSPLWVATDRPAEGSTATVVVASNPLGRAYSSLMGTGPRPRAVLWGGSLEAPRGAVYLCVVQAVRYFYRADIPFLQVVLKRTDWPPSTSSSPSGRLVIPRVVAAAPDQHARLLLALLVSVLRRANNCKPFLNPVGGDSAGGYDSAMTAMLARLGEYVSFAGGGGGGLSDVVPSGGRFRHVRQFLRDVEQMAALCNAQCAREQRRTVSLAQEILADARVLASRFFPGSVEDVPAVGLPLSASGTSLPSLATDDEESAHTEEPVRCPSAGTSTATASGAGGDSEASTSSAGAPVGVPLQSTFTAVLRCDGQGCNYLVPWEKYQQCVQSLQSSSLATVHLQAARASHGTNSGTQSSKTSQRVSANCYGKLTADLTAVSYTLPALPGRAVHTSRGVVVGTRDTSLCGDGMQPSQVMPWNYLQVNWFEPADCSLPSFVNPWEVTFTSA